MVIYSLEETWIENGDLWLIYSSTIENGHS